MSQASCTTGRVFDGLRRYPAPGYDPSSPVMTGDRTEIQMLGVSGGTVRHFVDMKALSVTNVTEPGHIFDPGYVTRSVVTGGGSIYIRTVGEGTGAWRSFNVGVARPAFTNLDRQIRNYVNDQ